MANKKLIFFDIDGTLITGSPEHYVPESTVKALEKLRNNGHICVINTGRPFSALDDVIMSIKVDGYICGCGTYVKMGNNTLFAQHVESSLCHDVVNTLKECNVDWILEGERYVFYTKRQYSSCLFNDIKSYQRRLPGIIRCLDECDPSELEFDKFCFSPGNTDAYDVMTRKFGDFFTFIDREEFYEVVPKNCSKATGMKFLEEHLSIANADTIAVGDSSNDIPMLEYATTGIVMGNAPESVHRYASYLTSAADQDGIYQAFQHYKMI